MIKSVTIINPFGDDPLVLNLPTSHEEHGIYIQKIEGIGPEKAKINTTSLAMEDGGIFNSAKADIRNIVITLGFYESSILHNSIEDSRHLTYKYFPKKKEITLIFDTDNRTSWINGYVESNTPYIFNKEESCQISIICPDPNFYSMDKHTSGFGGINGKFEFPFENNTAGAALNIVGGLPVENVHVSEVLPSTGIIGDYYYVKKTVQDIPVYDEYIYLSTNSFYLIQSNKVLYSADLLIGEINSGYICDIYYEGDIDVGITMTIHFLGPIGNNLIINNTVTQDTIKIDMEKVKEAAEIENIVSGDDIILHTETGYKSITFKRDDLYVDILNAMDKQYFSSSWFKLHKGLNTFTFRTDEGFENVGITIESYILYDGV